MSAVEIRCLYDSKQRGEQSTAGDIDGVDGGLKESFFRQRKGKRIDVSAVRGGVAVRGCFD